jgi:hypothetical protein
MNLPNSVFRFSTSLAPIFSTHALNFHVKRIAAFQFVRLVVAQLDHSRAKATIPRSHRGRLRKSEPAANAFAADNASIVTTRTITKIPRNIIRVRFMTASSRGSVLRVRAKFLRAERERD